MQKMHWNNFPDGNIAHPDNLKKVIGVYMFFLILGLRACSILQ